MRKAILALVVTVLLVLTVTMIGCSDSPPLPSAVQQKTVLGTLGTVYDTSVAVTVGNHTYVPLNFFGEAAYHVPKILGTLDAFEKAHPELEVTSWSLSNHPATSTTYARVNGIWLNHRPRTK